MTNQLNDDYEEKCSAKMYCAYVSGNFKLCQLFSIYILILFPSLCKINLILPYFSGVLFRFHLLHPLEIPGHVLDPGLLLGSGHLCGGQLPCALDCYW